MKGKNDINVKDIRFAVCLFIALFLLLLYLGTSMMGYTLTITPAVFNKGEITFYEVVTLIIIAMGAFYIIKRRIIK